MVGTYIKAPVRTGVGYLLAGFALKMLGVSPSSWWYGWVVLASIIVLGLLGILVVKIMIRGFLIAGGFLFGFIAVSAYRGTAWMITQSIVESDSIVRGRRHCLWGAFRLLRKGFRHAIHGCHRQLLGHDQCHHSPSGLLWIAIGRSARSTVDEQGSRGQGFGNTKVSLPRALHLHPFRRNTFPVAPFSQ